MIVDTQDYILKQHVALGYNPEYQQSFVRLSFQSMITPRTTFDYQVQDKNLITKKVQVIPSGYQKTRYKTERIMIKARDGKDIPVSLVYKSDFVKDGNSPMMLYGYGAYGHMHHNHKASLENFHL